MPLLAGCSAPGRVTLRQPFAPPSQQLLRLQSNWTFTAVDGGRRRTLLAFPLPGSEDGPRDFLIYLSIPDTTTPVEIAPQDAAGGRGFLIQCVGKLAGKAQFASGTIACRPVWFAPRTPQLTLDVTCDDGTQLRGTVSLKDNSGELREFETNYAADVAPGNHLNPDLATDGEAARRPTASP
jgi:hypothetical protein